MLTPRPDVNSYKRTNENFGMKHGIYILCVISLLLLTREAFMTVVSGNQEKQNNEHLWYPFEAVTELLAAVLFVIPGLVPGRAELPT